jgi:hypothetical protein
MNVPSDEQQLVIDNLKCGYNVVCSAVAGSGKSSTVLATANQMVDKQILQITYNSSLRLEIKEKVLNLSLQNIKIHTFHSLAVKYYSPDCCTDTGIRRILLNQTPPRTNISRIDLCMLDEFQDCSDLYFRFAVKFLRDMNSPVQLLILGDPLQCLYEFKGADSRFLTMSDKIWSGFELLSSDVFIQCTLRMSYRITNQMASFVNQAMFGNDMMLACKDGDPITYVRNNRRNIEKTVVYAIKSLLDTGVLPSEIFVLAASVKGINSHVRKMENILVDSDIPCYVPMFEVDKLDDRVIDGKIVFSTFHCAKGRQRKYVFVVGFDNNYFNQFARTLTDKTKCPNTLYVGCTRATHGLFLLEFDQFPTDRPLDFLKMGHHDFLRSDFVKFKGIPRSLFYTDDGEQKDNNKLINKKFETPTGMIKFIPDSVLDIISPIVDRLFSCRSPIGITIEIPGVIETGRGFFESVSDLNGIAIPCIYYDHLNKDITKSSILHEMVENALIDMKENEHMYIKDIVHRLPSRCESTSDYLFLANIYTAINERLYFKLKQIKRNEYTWLSDSVIDECKERLDHVIGSEPGEIKPEHTFIQSSMEEEHSKIDMVLSQFFPDNMRFRFTAIVDLVTATNVWELKCTSDISIDHKLQVIIYAWLWNMMELPEKVFKILNIKTGEIYILEYTDFGDLTTIVVALLKGRHDELAVKTDDEFMRDCREVISRNR